MGAPTLGGGLSPQDWLRSMAESDRKVRANARAAEAEAIADWIDELVGYSTGEVNINENDSILGILLERTRNVRMKTAEIRLGQMHVRYPEIPETKVEPLNDTEIIIKALEREAVAQETILRDLQK